MKKLIIFQLLLCSSWFCLGQSIPYGQSNEVLYFDFPINSNLYWSVCYYKPINYNDSSELIFYFHGQGGSGSDIYSLLTDIADRRGAMLVGPTSGTAPWSIARVSDTTWLPTTLKKLYKHILSRENKTFINTRIVGFSAGGQCVTRYMLIRQGINDSIPI